MTAYYGLFAPSLLGTRYAQEIWELYEEGELHPDVELTGYAEEDTHSADVDSVMLEIKAALEEEQARQERMRDADEPE
jgi:RIO kinase 1